MPNTLDDVQGQVVDDPETQDDGQEQVVDAQDAGDANADDTLEGQDDTADVVIPEPQSKEENQKYAEFRRKTEAEVLRAKQEADQASRMMNEIFETAYKGEINPYTGQTIETVDDFIAWKDQHEKQQLQDAGLPPDYIDKVINNHPVIQQANAMLEQTKQTQQRVAFEKELIEIQKVNPKIKSIEDLVMENKDNETFNALLRGGMDLSKAYATVHKLPKAKQDDTKNHMQSVGGGTAGSGVEREIPANELETYREAFPNETLAQLRTRYNRVLKRQGE